MPTNPHPEDLIDRDGARATVYHQDDGVYVAVQPALGLPTQIAGPFTAQQLIDAVSPPRQLLACHLYEQGLTPRGDDQ